MEIGTIRALQQVAGQDKNVTARDLAQLDADNSGDISAEEGAQAGIAAGDLQDVNTQYALHQSEPSAVVFHREVLKSSEMQQFVQENFRNLDNDGDGYLSKGELDQAIQAGTYSREDQATLQTLRRDIEDLEERSNDEWFDENDGITLKDMEVFARETASEYGAPVQRSANSESAAQMQDFVARNFAKIDTDGDGQLSKSEIGVAIHDPFFQGEDAAMLVALKDKISDLEEYSNDEWFDENDGITLKDMEEFVKQAERNPDDETIQKILNQYRTGKQKIDNANRQLYADSANPLASIRLDNMAQGRIDDCYFLAAVAGIVASDPQKIKDMIQDNGNGTYTVTFPGAPGPVTVSAPTDAEIALGATAGQDGLWLTILEKAYAETRNQMSGQHADAIEAIDGGDFMEPPIKLLTGHTADTDFMPLTSKDEMRRQLRESFPPGGPNRIVTASTFLDGDNSRNMIPNHVYTIIGYDPATDTVLVRNPWGQGADATNLTHNDTNNDGVFRLTLDEFDEYFNIVTYEDSTPIHNYDHLGSTYSLSGGLLDGDEVPRDMPF